MLKTTKVKITSYYEKCASTNLKHCVRIVLLIVSDALGVVSVVVRVMSVTTGIRAIQWRAKTTTFTVSDRCAQIT